ncbi:MAG: hypothetical protein AAF202_09100 [Pseudomonadota bacterium]
MNASKALLVSILAVFTVAISASGCGQNFQSNSSKSGGGGTDDDNEGADTGGGDDGSVLPAQIVLQAQKSYGPSQWEDGVFDENLDLERDVSFQITLPEEVPVIAGNAGNHSLTVVVDEDGANVVCSYKGGADVSKPIRSGNPTQIEKGQKYHFQSCSDGTSASETVTVDAMIRVIVNNGDSTETTRVEASFSVTED